MRRALLLALLVSVSCGRLGFDRTGDPGTDAGGGSRDAGPRDGGDGSDPDSGPSDAGAEMDATHGDPDAGPSADPDAGPSGDHDAGEHPVCANAVAVHAGTEHTCAIRGADSQVFCWGRNDLRQVGSGDSVDRLRPTPLVGPALDHRGVAPGASGTCSVLGDGSIWCWGSIVDGPIFAAPTRIAGDGSWMAIEGHGSAWCVRNGVTLACFGRNDSGQLGVGDTMDRAGPTLVPGSTSIFGVGEFHTCARQGDFNRCWGDNQFGQLGIGSEDLVAHPTPEMVLGDRAYSRFALGAQHTCAIATIGSVYCWGRNESGELGTGPTRNPAVATLVEGSAMLSALAAGFRFTCGLDGFGRIYCWGLNETGQLGLGDTAVRTTPTMLAGTSDYLDITAGQRHGCALRVPGQIVCWGANDRGQLGVGDTAHRLTPAEVCIPAP